jgi:hypothetical protein
MTTVTTPYGSAHTGVPALLARYRTLVDARQAIRTLESKGVDGDDLALVGAAASVSDSSERRTIDRRILSSITLALAVGIVGGVVIGAAIGAVAMGIVVLSFDLAREGAVFVLMVAWFAAAGAVFGALASVMRTLGFSESIPLTWEDEPDAPVWLAVFGESDVVRPGVEATHPVQVVDDPVMTAHPEELLGVAPAA